MTNKIVTAIGCIFLLGLLFSVAHEINYANNAEAAVIYNNQWRSYTGLSTDTRPTLEEKHAGSTFTETDTGRAYIWNGSAWAGNGIPFSAGLFDDTTSKLTAAGQTSVAVYSRGFNVAGYYIETASIGTSATVRILGRTALTNWTAITDSTVITDDGNHFISTTLTALTDSLKLEFLSENGGTSATIDESYVLGRQ